MLTRIEDIKKMLFHPIEWHFAPSVSKSTTDESTRGHGSCTASKATVSLACIRHRLLFSLSSYISGPITTFPRSISILTSNFPGLDLRRLQKLSSHSPKILPEHSRHPLRLLHRPRRHHRQRSKAEIRHSVPQHVCRTLQPVHHCPKELGCDLWTNAGGLQQRHSGCSSCGQRRSEQRAEGD